MSHTLGWKVVGKKNVPLSGGLEEKRPLNSQHLEQKCMRGCLSRYKGCFLKRSIACHYISKSILCSSTWLILEARYIALCISVLSIISNTHRLLLYVILL